MIQSQRYLKTRIHSVENVRKLARAMQLVSSAKLRPVQEALAVSKECFSKIDLVLNNILTNFEDASHPFLEKRPVKNTALCVIASDTGLSGIYNHRIIRAAEEFIRKNNPDKITLITVGKKAFIYFKKHGFNVSDAYLELHGRYSKQILDKIQERLTDIFLSKITDEAYIAYTYFESAARQKPVIEKILGIEPAVSEKTECISEPGINAVLEDFLPFYITNRLKIILLNAFAAEHSSRIVAMEEAADNARELLESLILLKNKIRQANITRDIIEIISSADALKG